MRPIKPPLLHPRKVRGGVKLGPGDIAPATSPTAWAAQRWLRLLEQAAAGAALVEGLEYARAGQTKKLHVNATRADASVQGRSDRPYVTSLSFAPLTPEQWEKVIHAMAEGAIYAAKLLAGELPSNIEEVFAPLNVKLFPTEASDVAASCSCADFAAGKAAAAEQGAPPTVWCKHVCCVAYLLGQRFAQEPYLMFLLRGLEGRDLLDRLRERRAVVGAGSGAIPVYTPHVPGVTDAEHKALDACLEHFWDAGPGLAEVDLPLAPPPVTHPLLRRLGPSPFPGAQFPLVGLLASCYEVISTDAIRSAAEEGATAEPPMGEAAPGEDDLRDDLMDDTAV